MNKSYLSIILICGLITALSVQQANAQADFGLRAGVNFSKYDSDDFDSGARTGFMAGAYLDINVPMSPFSIQPEVIYTQKGYENAATLKYEYLEVPVLAKFSLVPGPIQPHFYLGPYAGFFLNREVTDGAIILVVDKPRTDFGGIIGAGTDINAGVTTLNLGIRYGFGLVEAFENSQGKNSVLSIVGGISF